VEMDEQIVGAALNLVHGNSIYYYMGGFDDVAKNLRPGTALFANVIDRGIEEGYTNYDFLRGAEAYKYKWGASDVHTYHITVYPQGFVRGQLAIRLDSLQDGLRTMVRRMRK
ncbi:MAG: GNAT family N-acetyltransferase, partial [Woeseiaceae bacterium]